MKSILFIGIFCLIFLQLNAFECAISLYNNKDYIWSPEADTDVLRLSVETTDESTWSWSAPFSNGVMQKKSFKYYSARNDNCVDCVLSGYDNRGNLVTQERLFLGYQYKADKCVTRFSLECAYYGRGDFSGTEQYVGDGSDI